jgi:hypothetical protein
MSWSFTMHQAIFLAPLPGIEEEEAPTSITCSHVNLAPAIFLAPLPGKSGRLLQGEFFAHTSFTLFYCFALLYLFYLHHFISKTQKKLESLVVVISLLLVHHVDP